MSNKLIQRVESCMSNISPGPWASHLTVHDEDDESGYVDADLEVVSEANGQTIVAFRYHGHPSDVVFLADSYGMISELLDEIDRLERRNQLLESMLPEMPAGFLPPEPSR